jgi:nucleoside-diphosphate-sugar epimerase
MVELIGRRDSLDAFASFQMTGHWDEDGTQMVEAVRRVVARRTGTTPRLAAFPWWLIYAASPFVTTFREMLEMRYLWTQPVRMDGSRLAREIGGEPHTPLDDAVEATLIGLGCLAPAAG